MWPDKNDIVYASFEEKKKRDKSRETFEKPWENREKLLRRWRIRLTDGNNCGNLDPPLIIEEINVHDSQWISQQKNKQLE